jgi:hypothetical protein
VRVNASFQLPHAILEAAAREREVRLATYGRKTGKSHRVTIWIVTDGRRLFIRSGQGLRRHWSRNLLERGSAVLYLGGMDVPVRPRLLTDPDEARAVSLLYRKKYGPLVPASKPGQPLTPGEQATFEVLPSDG